MRNELETAIVRTLKEMNTDGRLMLTSRGFKFHVKTDEENTVIQAMVIDGEFVIRSLIPHDSGMLIGTSFQILGDCWDDVITTLINEDKLPVWA